MTEREFHSQYLSLADALYRVAFYILEDAAEAEDAVQELYLKLWRNRDALDGIRSPKAYAMTLLRNLCLDGIRNPKAYAMTLLRNLCLDRIRQASRIVESDVPEDMGGAFDPDAAMDQKERLEKVLAAVKSLPDKQREVLILRTVEGLSYEELEERTGLNYLTLRVLLSRARQTLKKKL